MKTKSIALTVGLFFLMSAVAMAGVPEEITFMGRLVHSGSPVTSPTSMTFELYLNATGGSSVWSDTQIVTPNGQGVYVAYLGSALNPLPTDNDTLWIQVTVVSTVLNPRRKLTSTPFALRADKSDDVGTLPNLDVSGDVTIDGKVGIGTTGAQKLTVNGGIAVSGTVFIGDGSGSDIRKQSANVDLNFRNSGGGIEMVLDSDGYLGIGTAGPTASLDVHGEVRFSTAVAQDGTGKILCIKSNGTIGTCDGAPTPSGNCSPCF